MPTQLVLLKGLASVGGGIAIGGGSYVVYQNSDSIKSIFAAKKEASNTPQQKEVEVSTYKLFLARYKDQKSTTETLTADSSLTCSIGFGADLACKIYKFSTTGKLDNTFTSTEAGTLTAVTATNTDFVDNSYFVIELVGTTKTVADLQNKTIALKTGSTVLGNFTFDQVLTGETAQSAAALAAVEETYIVKKSTTWNITAAGTSYKCKFSAPTGESQTKVDNYDSTCKLVKITTATSETVTTREHLDSLVTKITPETLHQDTDTYYKLIVNKHLLYNLAFTGSEEAAVQVELLKDTATTVGNLEILHKYEAAKFNGKTNLVLAKVKTTDTTTTGNLTAAKCSLSNDSTVVEANQFTCNLYTTTKDTASPTEKNLTFTSTEISKPITFTAGDYYVIKLMPGKAITDFDDKTSIFYQVPAESGNTNHKNIELDIVALMAGEADSTKKPIFLKTITQA